MTEGHCRTPDQHREDGVDIASWAANQRIRYHKGSLPAGRTEQLEQLPGWAWLPAEAAWERGFQALQEFANAEGSAAIRRDSVWKEYPVGAWVGEQRNRRYVLTGELCQRLETLTGWVWEVNADSWARHLEALKAFVEREGHAAVPIGQLEAGVPLGSWVVRHRAEYRQGSLSTSRVGQLQGYPGWTWDPVTERWERNFALLVAFVKRTGHARVPSDEKCDSLPLGRWVIAQRQSYKKNELDPDRETRLAGLTGWAWDAREAHWEEGLTALIEYQARTGHRYFPKTLVEDGFQLGQWLATQRAWKKDGRLRPDREARLTAALMPGDSAQSAIFPMDDLGNPP